MAEDRVPTYGQKGGTGHLYSYLHTVLGLYRPDSAVGTLHPPQMAFGRA